MNHKRLGAFIRKIRCCLFKMEFNFCIYSLFFIQEIQYIPSYIRFKTLCFRRHTIRCKIMTFDFIHICEIILVTKIDTF